jgi:hypothetical protein
VFHRRLEWDGPYADQAELGCHVDRAAERLEMSTSAAEDEPDRCEQPEAPWGHGPQQPAVKRQSLHSRIGGYRAQMGAATFHCLIVQRGWNPVGDRDVGRASGHD